MNTVENGIYWNGSGHHCAVVASILAEAYKLAAKEEE